MKIPLFFMTYLKFYNVIEFYDVECFGSKMTALWKFHEIWTRIRFLCLFFLNLKNVTNLFILICFKCTKVYYTIVKESSNSGL